MNRLLNIVKINGNKLLRQQPFAYNFNIIQSKYFSTGNLEEQFQNSLNNLKKLKADPGNEAKLKLYALFKQATVGPCNAPKPSVFNIVEKAKWDAWSSLGQLSNDQAKEKYISTVQSLINQMGDKTDDNSSTNSTHILTEKKDSVYWIKFNRPEKYNAITSKMYLDIINALQEADNDPSIKVAVMTGMGKYYCAGNDLRNFEEFAKIYKGDFKKGAEEGAKHLQKFVAAFIDFSKPLIGAVNGPAIGIAVTTLALMDCVIATDNSTFQTPFSSLGQSPEACATYTFPFIMGTSRASEILYFNYTMNAKEAEACGFISRIVPVNQFESHLNEWLYGDKGLVKNCFPKSMIVSKGLVRNEELKEKLHQINKAECEAITERWTSEECFQALQKFATRKQSNL